MTHLGYEIRDVSAQSDMGGGGFNNQGTDQFAPIYERYEIWKDGKQCGEAASMGQAKRMVENLVKAKGGK